MVSSCTVLTVVRQITTRRAASVPPPEQGAGNVPPPEQGDAAQKTTSTEADPVLTQVTLSS